MNFKQSYFLINSKENILSQPKLVVSISQYVVIFYNSTDINLLIKSNVGFLYSFIFQYCQPRPIKLKENIMYQIKLKNCNYFSSAMLSFTDNSKLSKTQQLKNKQILTLFQLTHIRSVEKSQFQQICQNLSVNFKKFKHTLHTLNLQLQIHNKQINKKRKQDTYSIEQGQIPQSNHSSLSRIAYSVSSQIRSSKHSKMLSNISSSSNVVSSNQFSCKKSNSIKQTVLRQNKPNEQIILSKKIKRSKSDLNFLDMKKNNINCDFQFYKKEQQQFQEEYKRRRQWISQLKIGLRQNFSKQNY